MPEYKKLKKVDARRRGFVTQLARSLVSNYKPMSEKLRRGDPEAIDWHLLRTSVGVNGDMTQVDAEEKLMNFIYN